MKLFLKRDVSAELTSFIVYDAKAQPLYTVLCNSETPSKQHIIDREDNVCSVIKYNSFLMNYFTLRCSGRFYILVPCIGDSFAFAIYGSTYRFSGDLAAGRFSVFSSDGEIKMTQKKHPDETGESYELDIHDEEHQLFLLSVAICADMYMTLTENNNDPCPI